MTVPQLNPVFAFGFEELVPFIVVVFAILSWIFNLIKEKNQDHARQDRPARRRPREQQGDSLQSEIDIFIQEVTQQRSDSPSQEAAGQRATDRDRRSQSRPPKKQPAAARPQSPPPKRESLGEELARRESLGSRDIGQGVGRHVQKHIQSHSVADEAKERLGHDVNASVSAHLGQSSSQPAEATHDEVNPMVKQVRDLLSNPATAGQAILLHEILTPRRLRRD